ncbi:Pr6Pr family membrane protein [Corynebacterium mendelii]|uniref:Pr6Pr family membrane protein n=1 Tax=Corynebacterium mendelii TaxID=2765362 RepID=A0A939E169_9CORY|nr:Pr6Pr family membrane protein [Corynebacterium mendelii]
MQHIVITRISLAVSALAAIVLTVASWATAQEPFSDWPEFSTAGEKLLAYYSYFTIWSTLAAILFGLIVLARSRFSAVLRINAVTMIAVTGIVYNFVLTHDPYHGVWTITSPTMHTVLPFAVPLVWLVSIPARGRCDVTFKTVAWCLVIPVTWTAWMLYRGEVTGGFYPYSIVDVPTIGWGATIRNIVLVYVFFFVLAGFMAMIERAVLSLRGRGQTARFVHPASVG